VYLLKIRYGHGTYLCSIAEKTIRHQADGGYFQGVYESPVISVLDGTGFHPFVVPVYRDSGYSKRIQHAAWQFFLPAQ
jgi:hypothetical protein